jgi:Zn-finger nucleic acid-binding protein
MGYRDAAIRCPTCGDGLEPQALDDAEIDVCPSCRGLWLDWFDGEIASLVKKARARPDIGAGVGSSASTDGREPRCPRCGEPLGIDFVHGVGLLRCGACAGVFVERQNVAALADVVPRSERESATEGLDLARFVKWLSELLFGAPPPRS